MTRQADLHCQKVPFLTSQLLFPEICAHFVTLSIFSERRRKAEPTAPAPHHCKQVDLLSGPWPLTHAPSLMPRGPDDKQIVGGPIFNQC